MTESRTPADNVFALGFTRGGDYKRANVES
jgi:hypothetical protein